RSPARTARRDRRCASSPRRCAPGRRGRRRRGTTGCSTSSAAWPCRLRAALCASGGIAPQVVEEGLDVLVQPGVVELAQQLERVAGAFLEHEGRIVEPAGVEIRDRTAVVHELAALKGAALVLVAVELDGFILDCFARVFHGPARGSQGERERVAALGGYSRIGGAQRRRAGQAGARQGRAGA